MSRTISPDDRVEAIVQRRDCGATTSYAYEVTIVPKGKKAASSDDVLMMDKVDGLNLRWIEPRLLSITYSNGRIFKFKNFWQSRDVDDFNYVVKIKESEAL